MKLLALGIPLLFAPEETKNNQSPNSFFTPFMVLQASIIPS